MAIVSHSPHLFLAPSCHTPPGWDPTCAIVAATAVQAPMRSCKPSASWAGTSRSPERSCPSSFIAPKCASSVFTNNAACPHKPRQQRAGRHRQSGGERVGASSQTEWGRESGGEFDSGREEGVKKTQEEGCQDSCLSPGRLALTLIAILHLQH
jgi:hypothetical protein